MESSDVIDPKIDIAIAMVRSELLNATRKFGPFNNPHEGYAVILEELDELWDEIKANLGNGHEAFNEARQIAAMALRYMVDLCYIPQDVWDNWAPLVPRECKCGGSCGCSESSS
jgi:hypothetical protein